MGLQEKAAPDTWYDEWSPSQILSDCGVPFLLAVENIRAVSSAHPGDDPNTLIVLLRSGGEDITIRVEEGRSKLQTLRHACEEQLSIMGNQHWGTVTDVVMLSEALNLGLIIMSDREQQRVSQNPRWMFGLTLERADFPYWITLYNIDNTHFRLLMSSTIGGNGEKTCVFSTEQMPDSLRDHWNLCNER